MNAPFRPRDYMPRDPDQSFWDSPKPRITFVEDIEADLHTDRYSRWFAIGAIAVVTVTVLIPGFIYIVHAVAK